MLIYRFWIVTKIVEGTVNRLRRIVLAVMLGMSCLTVAFAQSSSPIQITISTSASLYNVGEPMKLQIALTNVSDQPVKIYSASGEPNGGEAEDDNGIYVRDSSGKQLPRIDGRMVTRKDGTTVKMPSGSISRRGVNLAPNDHFQDFTILTRLFDLTKPGEYSVTIGQDIRINHSGPEPTLSTATSNTVRFTIVALPKTQ
jgi:hypothetical protein